MLASTLVEHLHERQASQAANIETEWVRFVMGIDASKKEPDPDSVLAKLAQLGRTPDDLAAALARLRHRRGLVQKLAEVPALQAEWQQHTAAVREERERFAPIETAHRERVRELEHLSDLALTNKRYSQQAEHELRKSCNPLLRERLQLAVETKDHLDKSIQANRIETEGCTNSLATGDQYARPTTERRLAALRTAGPQLAERLVAVVAEIDSLKAQALAVESF